MTPSEIVDSALDLLVKDEADRAFVRLRKGVCEITDSEGYPYSDKARGYDTRQAEAVAQVLRERGFRVEVAYDGSGLGQSSALEDYRRLSGLRPSLLERATGSDRVMLSALSSAFPVKVRKADVPFIHYRLFTNSVEMEDQKGRLGGVLTSVGPKEVDLKAFMKWLKQHGARQVKDFGEYS